MLKRIYLLTKAQLCNFASLNEFRHTKDKKKKATMTLLAVVWLMLIAMLCAYIGVMAYGYVMLGMGDIFPMYLVMVCAIIIFFFTMLKAGSVLFSPNTYEILCSLPVTQTAIVASRYFSMYFGNVLLCFVVMIPGMTVYGTMIRPGVGFYFAGIVGTIFLPMIPMTAAVILGALITGISSRMKHKSLVTTVLTLLLLFASFGLTGWMTKIEGNVTDIMLQNMAQMIADLIQKIYPPAVWLGNMMVKGNVTGGLLYFGVSVFIFAVMLFFVSSHFQSICQNLFSTHAKHDYKMGQLKEESILKALYKKEAKRYFSSSIYVSNTIIGPMMTLVFAAAVLFMGIERMESYLPIPGGLTPWMAFAVAAINCLMTTTCTSISMEGKEWWIVKSLPVDTKALLDSKVLLNLSLIAPFYVISELLLLIGMKPAFMEMVWLIVLPAVFILFACVFGITMNLKMPLMTWENDARVVKQSASAMVGGLGGCLIVILCAVPMAFVGPNIRDIWRLGITVGTLMATFLLYQWNKRFDLRKI